MASSLDDQNSSQPSQPQPSHVQQRIRSQFQGDWVDRLSINQMFILIDGVLPFEVCLYYQLLPLFLEGNRLHLGMVSPEDSAAAEYARRLVSYLNYSLVPRPISSEALQVVLTAYLNDAGKKQPAGQDPFSYGKHRHSSKGYAIRKSLEQEVNPNDRKTLIVDSPDDLNTPCLPELVRLEIPLEIPDLPKAKAVPLTSPIPRSTSPSAQPSVPPSVQSSVPLLDLSLLQTLPVLDIKAEQRESPLETLISLPPMELLQELLVRVLVDGIGRLYFECHADSGRILWSQDGVLKSALEHLPLSTLQGMIQQLKQLVNLSLNPVDKLQQAEAEYLYDGRRILLRCRFIPTSHGEEATLQVLRGAALKFYQQQQVSRLERDALGIAKQLQNKLKEIRDRAHAEPGLISAKFEVLPTLSQLLQMMEGDLDDLGVSKDKLGL
jgi:type II secretory ATPase GspE/PulE/Tfp pilus assembly ATPase PilB-like protein